MAQAGQAAAGANRLGEGLRQLREARGLTQRDLAALAGLAPSALSRYESGSHRPRSDTLERLLAALGCDFQELGRHMAGAPAPPQEDAPPPDAPRQGAGLWRTLLDSLVAQIETQHQQTLDLQRRHHRLLGELEAVRQERNELLKKLRPRPRPQRSPSKKAGGRR